MANVRRNMADAYAWTATGADSGNTAAAGTAYAAGVNTAIGTLTDATLTIPSA